MSHWRAAAHEDVSGLATALERQRPETARDDAGSDSSALVVSPQTRELEQLRAERRQSFETAREQGLHEGRSEAERLHRLQAAKAELAFEAACKRQMDELARLQREMQALAGGITAALADVSRATIDQAAVLTYAAALRLYGETGVAQVDFAALCAQILLEQRQRPVTLLVAPAQLALVHPLTCEGLQVRADATLAPGQCRIDTGDDLIDTGLDVRLDALRNALLHGTGSRQL